MTNPLDLLACHNADIREQLRRYQRAADAAHEGIITCDATDEDLPTIFCNDGFCELTGYEREEVLGRNCRFLQCKETSEETVEEIRRAIANEQPLTTVILNQKKDGEKFWNELSITPVQNEAGETVEFVGFQRDVTERVRAKRELKEAKRDLREQALYDELTELPNRTLFRDRLDHAIRRARRDDFYLSVAMVDVDNFKAINDSFGHSAGDAVLQRVASRIRETLRNSDTVARLGGDEFMLLLESTSSRIDFRTVGERLRSALAPPLTIRGTEVPVSVSIGFSYAEFSHLKSLPTTDLREQLIRAADRAMYQSKRQSGTSWTVVSTTDSGESSRRVQRENRIRKGLNDGEFLPFFQPIFSLPSKNLVALEVLARWDRPDQGIASPAKFIPLAEKSSLICDLGVDVLQQACQLARQSALISNRPDKVPLYVNLSPRQLKQERRVDELIEVVESFQPDVKVGFEVTESQLLESRDPLTRIRNHGIDIIVDDFGSGYSSFERLKSLEIDALKLDMSFVQGALTNDEDAAISETVATLGQRLGLPVVGEGVESTRHLQFLIDAGFRAAQGYHLGRPGRLSDILKELPREPKSSESGSLIEDTVPNPKSR